MHERVGLITGVAGEIGGSLVEEFLKDGWAVCGLDVTQPVTATRPGFSFRQCDLADGADAEEKIDEFHQQYGPFDAVINCAGMIANAPLLSFQEGRLVHHDFGLWNRVLASCLSSAFHVTACAAVKMAGPPE